MENGTKLEMVIIMNNTHKRWEPIPDQKPLHCRMVQPERYHEFEITPKSKLNAHTKSDLVNEVHRLQTLMREIAVEVGIARRSKGGEYTIARNFISNIIKLLRIGWSVNIV